jgi:MHS family citrate/tricarballylate:H+ symporter-like MFS transporter
MSKPASKIKNVVQVLSGNFFEAFDLIVFGTFAKIIGDNFFPGKDPQLSLMLAFLTFASAYVMRFVGAVVLGPYFDHAGRRKGLLVSFTLMAVGTGMIALAPTYAAIGTFAPMLLILGRLIQGFSVGSETGGVNAYLVEIAPPNKRAFYVSWNATSFHLATLLAIGIGFILDQKLTSAEMAAWGWRIPMILGCGLIPVIFVIRKNLAESEAFQSQSHHPTMREVLVALAQNWRIAITGMFMVMLSSCFFYFTFTFMPVFAKANLGMTTADSLWSTSISITYSLILVPIFALLSDRIGRFPILATTAALVILTAYPTLYCLVTYPGYWSLIRCQLWFATLYSAYASSGLVGLSEVVPSRIRATGYGVSTTLGLALFAGCTPLISTWLIHVTGNKIAPGFWLMFVATCSLIACFILFKAKIAVRGETPAVVYRHSSHRSADFSES